MSNPLESNDIYDDTNINRLWLFLLILGMKMTAWQFVEIIWVTWTSNVCKWKRINIFFVSFILFLGSCVSEF